MKLTDRLRAALDWKDYVALTLGGGLTVLLGLGNITRWSIWFDEAFSEHITRHSFFDIARYTAQDVHPPLYYWVLKIWRSLFGSSELALRSLSLFFLLVAVIFAYILARKVFSRRAAIVTLLLLAISPMLFRYGVEARMYTMELAIAVGATGALWFAYTNKSKKAWILYGVLAGLGMLTHYLSLVVWIAQGLWLLWQHKTGSFGKSVRSVLASGYMYSIIAGVAVTVAWVPFMVWQVVNIQGGGFWIRAVTMQTLPNLVGNMYTYLDADQAQGWCVVVLLAVIAATIYAARLAYRSFGGTKKAAYQLLLMTAIVPPLLLVIGSMPPLRSSFVDRYLLVSVAMWFVTSAVAITHARQTKRFGRPADWLLAVTCFVLAAGCVQVYTVGNVNKDNTSIHTMRSAMRLVEVNGQEGEPIIADTSWHYYESSFYETPAHTVYFRSEDNTKVGAYAMLRDETAHKITDMQAFAKEHPVAWFITVQPRDVGSRIPKDWRELETILVDEPSELRAVKMQYIGPSA